MGMPRRAWLYPRIQEPSARLYRWTKASWKRIRERFNRLTVTQRVQKTSRKAPSAQPFRGSSPLAHLQEQAQKPAAARESIRLSIAEVPDTPDSEYHSKGGRATFKLIFSSPLDSLRDTTFDLTPYASEERYRFINCDSFINDRTLQIYETTTLPTNPDFYSAISYVWFGLSASPSDLEKAGSFRVYCGTRSDGTPREDGGPISMQVLEFACFYSSKYSASYLWLDRLCILQTSKRDKLWQIGRMFEIYEGCQECVVLPGGLQRLASVFDETSWADRAWTYQEAIITWEYAVVLTSDWHRPKGEQHWLVDGECHWKYLQELFLEGGDLLAPLVAEVRSPDTSNPDPKPRLLLGRNGAALDTLRRIMEYKAYNHMCEEGEEVVSEYQIRQLLLQGVQMRVSSRPVDMVFSILGLVGAEEDFSQRLGEFGENERLRATLALVETIFRHEPEVEEEAENSSTLLDVPLWKTLEPTNPAHLPSLRELTMILDTDAAAHQATETWILTTKNLPRWEYNVALTEEEPERRAKAVVQVIPETELMSVYHGEQEHVTFKDEEEGVIQLCRTLDYGKGPKSEEQLLEALSDHVVFGWSLRMEGHPYIRFYKLDISHLFQ
ncbi:unnamed protein product [Somion occarium]|uniref:Heterokaryon incompatibility domain-containing protein n=1 Tax=Somion occarium TaxID=3059160 RepID=A0ABP1DDP8_9APHY